LAKSEIHRAQKTGLDIAGSLVVGEPPTDTFSINKHTNHFKMAETQAPAKPSFLGLPVEIRLKIYEYLVGSPKYPLYRFYHERRIQLDPPGFQPEPFILYTCRKCHNEGISLLYRSQIFMVDWISYLDPFANLFVKTIGPTNASSIRYFLCDMVYYALSSGLEAPSWEVFLETLSKILSVLPSLEVVQFKGKPWVPVYKPQIPMEKQVRHAIEIADALMGKGGHPTLRRLVQYSKCVSGTEKLNYHPAWALVSMNNDHPIGWSVDDDCVSRSVKMANKTNFVLFSCSHRTIGDITRIPVS
jgi:hypothetical protein